MSKSHLFTSESVSEGHPDKIADQISDAVLDAILTEDKGARVACETLIKTGMVVIAGEVTTAAWVDLERIARDTIENIGYTSSDVGFDGEQEILRSATAIFRENWDPKRFIRLLGVGVSNLEAPAVRQLRLPLDSGQ